MKHTKGPWTFKKAKKYPNEFDIIFDKDYFIATTWDGVNGEHTSKDNARLISCAPEMLEGLIFALKYSEDKIMGTNKFMPDDFYRNVTSVIEKATGLTIEEVLKND